MSFDATVVATWSFFITFFVALTIIELIDFIYNKYKEHQFHKLVLETQPYLEYPREIKREIYSWTEYPDSDNKTIEEMLEIIDDALSYGFEFKIENHKILWRDI